MVRLMEMKGGIYIRCNVILCVALCRLRFAFKLRRHNTEASRLLSDLS